MMQPIDPLSQLALCCGFGSRRRRRNPYFYSPSTANLDSGNVWTIANPYAPQPYFLVTQPVIIASNTAPSQTNTMTLVQHAQSATNASHFPALSLLGNPAGVPTQAIQPAIVSSQCAIYNSPATTTALNTSTIMTAPQPPAPIYEATSRQQQQQQHHGVNQDQGNHQNYTFGTHQKPMLPISSASSTSQSSEVRQVTLSSEIFKQLEVIEKQIDLSRDMELIEKHGIVIMRAIDPYSLMPHLTEATLRRYHGYFLFSDNYVIRFIEIIKRPGQTLGLYIRRVQFEVPNSGGSRPGLVITKIDTDSPIYNSLVLHVGDEILSVNLVDIQGMSLDDVVVIMSIPKRLVLALRIPKDRDQLLSISLMQQQNHLNRGATGNVIPRDSYNQKTLMNNSQSIFRQNSSSIPEDYRSQFDNEMQANDIRRNMSGRNLKPGQELHHARPIRVHSANQMNENFIELPEEPDFRNTMYESDQPRRYSSIDCWPNQHYEPTISDGGSMNPSNHHHERVMLNKHLDQSQVRVVPNSKEELQDPNIINPNDNFQDDFRFDPNLDTITEQNVSNKERTTGMHAGESSSNHQVISFKNQEIGSSYPLSSTLPRRTLPARPNNIPASTSPTTITTTKPLIISNLRLGDTPEQSSYFSSSIDAINRELKELRRQRMALSNDDRCCQPNNSDF